MTFYTTFTTVDGTKAAYIYQSKKQLIAADCSKAFKVMQDVSHNKADAGVKAVKEYLENNGFYVLRPVKADEYFGCDFLLPLPGKEFLQKRCYY